MEYWVHSWRNGVIDPNNRDRKTESMHFQTFFHYTTIPSFNLG